MREMPKEYWKKEAKRYMVFMYISMFLNLILLWMVAYVK